MATKFRVQLWEFERGWGRRPDGYADFDTIAQAKDYQEKINSRNTLSRVPDYYTTAEDPVAVEVSDPVSLEPAVPVKLGDKLKLSMQNLRTMEEYPVTQALEELKKQITAEIDRGDIPRDIKVPEVLGKGVVVKISDREHKFHYLYQQIIEPWAKTQEIVLLFKIFYDGGDDQHWAVDVIPR